MNSKSPSERAALLLATWFGCGYAPWAPGTVGSAAAVTIAVVVGSVWKMPAVTLLAVAALITGPAIWSAGRASAILGRKDPQVVVIDEVAGQWVTLGGAAVLNWKSYVAGFLLFRLFDIWKPWPIRRMEALPGGTGIVVDDLMAGAYGALVLYLAGCFNFY